MEIHRRLNGVKELLGELGGGIDSIIDGSDYFDVKFKGFIVGAGLAYDYTNNRLVCFNGKYNYCYVYNLANPGWGAMALSIARRSSAHSNSSWSVALITA